MTTAADQSASAAQPCPSSRLIGVVVTTVASAAEADRLAALLVGRGLAACVQVEPIVSHYRWQGVVQREDEWRLECKTATDRVSALQAALAAEHPYELPELLVQMIQSDSRYALWVDEQVRGAE